jgi:chromate reductase, NAD(P)H dehydrogenase (quinone)
MRVLAFAASLRQQSLNRKLLENAADIAREQGAELDVHAFRDFDMPIYDGDLEKRDGLPPGAQKLVDAINQCAAVMIACPEYNYSIAGPLKNAIDWASRARPMPWRGKSIYLMAASPGAIGGIRGLWQTRIPLEGCGAIVFPDMFSLAHAGDAFDADGKLVDDNTRSRLATQVTGFVRLAESVEELGLCGEIEKAEKLRQREIARALEEESALQPHTT